MKIRFVTKEGITDIKRPKTNSPYENNPGDWALASLEKGDFINTLYMEIYNNNKISEFILKLNKILKIDHSIIDNQIKNLSGPGGIEKAYILNDLLRKTIKLQIGNLLNLGKDTIPALSWLVSKLKKFALVEGGIFANIDALIDSKTFNKIQKFYEFIRDPKNHVDPSNDIWICKNISDIDVQMWHLSHKPSPVNR